MNQKRLHDELTVVALVLIIGFIAYYLFVSSLVAKKLEARLYEAQNAVIILDKRLTKAEHYEENSRKQIEELNGKMLEYIKYDIILKDIATSWEKTKN